MDVDPVVPLAVEDLVWLAVARAEDLGARRRATRVRDLRRGLAVAVPLGRVGLGRSLSRSGSGSARCAGCARAGAAARRARRGLVALRCRARWLRARLGTRVLVGAAAARGLRRDGVLLELPRCSRRVPGRGLESGLVRGSGLGVGLGTALAGPVAIARESRARERDDAQDEQDQTRQARNTLGHLVLSSFSNNMIKRVTSQETSDQPIWIRVTRTISLDLRTELGAERLFQGRNDAVAELGGVLVGECPLGLLERDREGDRLLSRLHLATAIDVEGTHLTELGPGRLVSRGDELPCGHVVRNDEGEILAHRRIRDDVLVDDQVADAVDEGIDVELERTPFAR